MRQRVAAAFDEVDVIAWPTVPAPAPPLEAPLVELKQRVTKRFAGGAYFEPLDLAGIPGLVTAKRKREGVELVLADQDEQRAAELARRFPAISQPIVPTLEELFIDVTSGEITGPFTAGGIS